MPIVAWVLTGISAAAAVAITAWYVWRSVRGADTPDFTVLGMDVHSSKWSEAESDVKVALPPKDRVQEYLWTNVDRLRVALEAAGAEKPNCSLAGMFLWWMPVKRVKKITGGYEASPDGDRLYFYDPAERPNYRSHDWYAGRRLGNCVKVGWVGVLPATELLHEIGHALRQRNGLPPDERHLDAEFWRSVR